MKLNRGWVIKWFKHDTDANQDNKLQNVLLDYGLEGYGLYWYCVELIWSKVDKDNITFDLEHDARVIARNTGCTPQKVEEMMRYFVSLNLFQSSDNAITCLAMAKRLDKSMTSNLQMRKIIESLGVNNTVKEGYVYFIENRDKHGDLIEIKIGRSANPHSRLIEHQRKYSEFGFNLTLVHTIKSDDCISLETEIHRKLKDHEIRKEWFKANDFVFNLLRHDYGLTTTCKIRLEEIRIDKDKIKNSLVTDKSETRKIEKNKKYKFSENHLRFANAMYKKITEVNGAFKKPNLEAWAHDSRLMVEREKISLNEYWKIFLWANNDRFWRDNIQSPAKLRKQYPQLLGKMKNENTRANLQSANGRNASNWGDTKSSAEQIADMAAASLARRRAAGNQQ